MTLVSSADPGVLGRFGLTREQAATSVWTITDGGDAPGPIQRDGGARAVAMALAVAWQSSLPLWPWHVPGLPRALEALYRCVARHRHRLP